MKIVSITNAKGFTFKRLAFSFNENGFYSVEDMTKTLVLEDKISRGDAWKIEMAKTIEEQLEMLKPFESFLTKVYQFGY